MRSSVLLALSLGLPSLAFAQQSSIEQVKAALAKQQQSLNTCPIGFKAQRSGTGATVWTIAQEDAGRLEPGAKTRPGDVGVHVQLKAFQNEVLKDVELSVAYVPAGVHYTPVERDRQTAPRKTFSLVAADAPSHQLQGHLLVGPSAGVTRVYLTHITYADGTEWRPGKGASCSVAPNGFVLIQSGK